MKIANYFIAGIAALMLTACSSGGADLDTVKELSESKELTTDQKIEILEQSSKSLNWITNNFEDIAANAGALFITTRLNDDDLKDDDLKDAVNDNKEAYNKLAKKIKEFQKEHEIDAQGGFNEDALIELMNEL